MPQINPDMHKLKYMPYVEYLQSDWWKKVSFAAKWFYNFKCQTCGSSDNLQTHHRDYDRKGCERPEDLSVLCNACHEKIHGISKTPAYYFQEACRRLSLNSEFSTLGAESICLILTKIGIKVYLKEDAVNVDSGIKEIPASFISAMLNPRGKEIYDYLRQKQEITKIVPPLSLMDATEPGKVDKPSLETPALPGSLEWIQKKLNNQVACVSVPYAFFGTHINAVALNGKMLTLAFEASYLRDRFQNFYRNETESLLHARTGIEGLKIQCVLANEGFDFTMNALQIFGGEIVSTGVDLT